MKLLRLVAWTVWFMLSWTVLAHAAPVGAIIAGIAGILAKGGIGAMLIKAAFGIALQVGSTLLQKAMAKKQAQPGITGQLQVGGNNSLAFLVGNYATAGSLEYTGEWGTDGKTPNAYHVQVITVSDLMQGGIGSRIWINGQKCTIDFGATPGEMGYPVIEYRRKRDHMWVKVLDGSQSVADPYLRAKFGSNPDKPFLADMIGRGLTVVVLTALVNRELLTQLPAGRYEPFALPMYDPRKDTSVGGSGAHRWNDQSTWEPTGNLVVIVYNLLRGVWYDGELIYGPAIPPARLPLANWFAAMNECDIPVELEDGTFEPQFHGGYEIRTAEHEPMAVIQELLKGCNGKLVEVGGIYKIHVGAPSLPVYFVTDEDFVVTEEQEFDPFPGLEATFNGATASYPEPEAGWEMKDAPQRLFPDYEEEDDGRRLLADFQFNAVISPTQVQRLMLSMVQDGRPFRKHRGMLPPSAFVLEPMDVISWTSVREGYVSKLFSIDSMDDLVNANQAVAMRETDPSDFDWNFSTDQLPWVVGDLTPNWPKPQVMVGWSVEPAEFKDAAGNSRRPSIKVNYPGADEDVSDVIVRVRLAADESQVYEGRIPYGPIADDDGNPITPKSVILNGTFVPNEDHEVQGEFSPFSGRAIEPTGWMAVKTPDVRLGLVDIFPDEIVDEVVESIETSRRFVSPEETRALRDRLLSVATWTVEQDGANVLDKEEWRKALTASAQNITAAYDLRISTEVAEFDGKIFGVSGRVETLEVVTVPALISAQDAITVRVTQAENTIGLQGAAITNLQGALTGYTGPNAVSSALSGMSIQIEGLGNDVTSLAASLLLTEATVGKFSASGLFRAEQIATMTGAQSTVAIAASATAGGAMTTAAIVLNALAGGIGEVGVIANRFFVATDTAGTGKTGLFVVDGGVVYIDKARIKDLTAAQINTASIAADTAFLATLVVGEGNFQALSIGADKIKLGELTRTQTSVGAAGSGSGTWIAEVTIPSESGNPITLILSSESQGGDPSANWQVQRLAGTGVSAKTIGSGINRQGNLIRFNETFVDEDPPIAAAITYRVSGGGDFTPFKVLKFTAIAPAR